MADTVSKKLRSEIMSRIRSRNTKIETEFSNALRKNRIKFRRNEKRMYGKPDFVFRDAKIVLFIDSCFWHGCPYHCRMPKSNKTYWNIKINRNKKRDREVSRWHKEKGWTIFRFWEHEINNDLSKCIEKIKKQLKKNRIRKKRRTIMRKVLRKRHGYLWVTDSEYKRIKRLIDSCGIYRNNDAVRIRADFVRVAVIAMGELLKKRKLNITKNATQEKVIKSIVNHFYK